MREVALFTPGHCLVTVSLTPCYRLLVCLVVRVFTLALQLANNAALVITTSASVIVREMDVGLPFHILVSTLSVIPVLSVHPENKAQGRPLIPPSLLIHVLFGHLVRLLVGKNAE